MNISKVILSLVLVSFGALGSSETVMHPSTPNLDGHETNVYKLYEKNYGKATYRIYQGVYPKTKMVSMNAYQYEYNYKKYYRFTMVDHYVGGGTQLSLNRMMIVNSQFIRDHKIVKVYYIFPDKTGRRVAFERTHGYFRGILLKRELPHIDDMMIQVIAEDKSYDVYDIYTQDMYPKFDKRFYKEITAPMRNDFHSNDEYMFMYRKDFKDGRWNPFLNDTMKTPNKPFQFSTKG